MPQYPFHVTGRPLPACDHARRSRYRAILLSLGLILGSLTNVSCNHNETASPPPPANVDPPTVDGDTIDPEVAAAIESASKSIQANPTDGRHWGELGMVFFAHDFKGQAIKCFQQAAVHSPEEGRWPYLEARCIAAIRPKEAEQLLSQAVSLCGNDPPSVRLFRVELLLELMQLDEAEAELNLSLDHDPNNGRGQLAKARLLFMKEQHQDCMDVLQKLDANLNSANEQSGRRQPLYLLGAESLRRLGKPEQAEQLRKQAMTQVEFAWPDEYMSEVSSRKTGLKTYLVKADRLYNRGQYEPSIALLRNTVASYPDSLWGKILLGRALIRTGGPSSSYPQDEKQKRLLEAVQILEETLQTDPNAVEAYFRLAVAKDYLQDLDSAIDLYQQAIKLKSDFTMAHYNLASCLNRKRDMDGAIQALEASVQAEPEFVDGHHMLGRLLIAQRRYSEAAKHLGIASQLAPSNQQIAERYRATMEKAQVLDD